MAYRLKSRERQIPHGLRFLQPETNWRPQRFASFMTIVAGLISHRRKHSDLAVQRKWKLDANEVADEVDEFNANYCMQMGWTDYVLTNEGAPPPPKPQALLAQEKNQIAAAASRAKKIWSGIRTLDEWIDSGTPPVETQHAERRAAICAVCPKNGKGDLTSWFTKPAASTIAKHIERKNGMKLSTPDDAKLNVCEVCLCPLQLKVHTPISFIRTHTSPEVLAELTKVPKCWIPAEFNQ
jgi:hypothetical protein